MSTSIFRTRDHTLQVAPVGAPIEGQNHQVLRAFVEEATASAPFAIGQELALRAVIDREGWGDAEREERRDLLHKEATYVAKLYPELSPIVLDVTTESGEGDLLLATQWLKGQTLERHIQAHHPQGAPLELGLKWSRQIAEALQSLHEDRLVHRNVQPQNILISDDNNAYLIGFSSIQPRQSRPSATVIGVHELYSAPEIIRELSGTFVTPKVDVFSLGATMSFIFSGLPLTEMVEAPITVEAWSRLSRLPDGIRLLIAHCMQPFHKNRMVNAGAVLPLLTEETLPTKFTKNFGAIYLAAPWTGSGDESRIGHLSPGPLVSRIDPPDVSDLESMPAFKPVKQPFQRPETPALASPHSEGFDPSAWLGEDDADGAAPASSPSDNAALQTPQAQAAPSDASALEDEASPAPATDDAPFWHKDAPEQVAVAKRQADAELDASAPFFARRGIPPLTIVFVTVLIALTIVFISQLIRGT